MIYAMIIELPFMSADGIAPFKSGAIISPPAVINAAVIAPPAVINPARSTAISKVKVMGSPLEEFPFNLATEWTGAAARGCVGDTLGVFRIVDVVDEGLAAFATLPAHLVASGVTNIIVTIKITKNCFTMG